MIKATPVRIIIASFFVAWFGMRIITGRWKWWIVDTFTKKTTKGEKQ